MAGLTLVLTVAGCIGYAPILDDRETKAFERAIAFSETLGGWALLIVAGSIVVLVGVGYHRPRYLWQRLMYLLFLPGWCLLARSMLYGVKVQRVYLAFLFTSDPQQQLSVLKDRLGDNALEQILNFQYAIGFFALWLLFYFIWWLCAQDRVQPGDKP